MNRNTQALLDLDKQVYVIILNNYEYEVERYAWDNYHRISEPNTDEWLEFYRTECSWPDGTSNQDWITWRPINVPKDCMELSPIEFDAMIKRKRDKIFREIYGRQGLWI